jgi:hypothetical protein
MIDGATEERPALAAWVELSDALMRGLVHALNNRVTAVSAFLELAALGDEELTAQRVLPGELARLQQVNMLFRLLLTEEMPAEAMELGSVLDDALVLHSHHSRLREVRCDVVREGDILPIRVPRWALLRLLLLMLECAKQQVGDTDSKTPPAVLHVAGRNDVIELTVFADCEPSRYALEMAALCGATLEFAEGNVTARLPTLQELRRNEHRAGNAEG